METGCERFGRALKIGKDQRSEVSVGVSATPSKDQDGIPGPLFIPIEGAWPVLSPRRCRPHPAFGHPLPVGEGYDHPSPHGRRCREAADEGQSPRRCRPHPALATRSQWERDTITLLPMGEGAAKRRMRADHPGVAALTRPSATRSQWERDTITLLPMGEGAAKRRMRADQPGVARTCRSGQGQSITTPFPLTLVDQRMTFTAESTPWP